MCEAELDEALNKFLQRPPECKLKIIVNKEVFPPVNVRLLKNEYIIKERKPYLEILETD